ncbi:MAG TPA: serine acetyltransferase [Candidatus Nanoarchaeia archaeon]|nr:serine acetyltransferase [Candidatus Nanoarchaeia archaeon]
MSFKLLYQDLKSLHDYKMKNCVGFNSFFLDTFKNIIFCPPVWFLIIFRIGQLINKIPLLKTLYLLFIWRPLTLITGIEIYPETKVGGGLVLPHFGQIFINPRAIIGKNCIIYHSVTIGTNFISNGFPVIGDNVMIGAGAKIIGPVKIEDNSKINANKVISK